MTGEKIRSACAPMCKKLSLELGGKNPAVVFADCDLEEAVSTCVRSSFSNQVSLAWGLSSHFSDIRDGGSPEKYLAL